MSTQMQNKIDNGGAAPEDDFSLDLLDEAQMARLKRAFCIFDKDDSGKISHEEMMGVRPRGRPPTPPLYDCLPAARPRCSLAGLAVTRDESDQRRVGGDHPRD